MIPDNLTNLDTLFQNGPEFWSDTNSLLDSLKTSNDTTAFHFVTIMLQKLTIPVIFITLLTAFDLLVVIPANVVTIVVIVKNRELWTSSNTVLAINGLIQATGTAVYLVIRWGGFSIFPFIDQSYKPVLYTIGWWIFCIMMRTGNNRYVTHAHKF